MLTGGRYGGAACCRWAMFFPLRLEILQGKIIRHQSACYPLLLLVLW
ncbi:hypothetical protein DLM_0665 [Aquitalea magnusonii]|uniref:Uncharacterized protein n=1 Tax=Aquitalea magnusonii TaxID=332411 RepID=A0A3G9G8K6_9NEIS|nr:hypothetical protein DLM_0665 [Aquitalea magnusonii]